MHGALWTLGWGLVLSLVAPPALAAAPVDPHAAPRVMFPLAPPTRAGTATVRVRVLSARTGEPLAGASAGFVLPRRGRPLEPFALMRADASGLATFSTARPGIFTVCAYGPGHAQACERDVGVVAGGTLSVDLRLPAVSGTVLGTVRQQDGSPAAGVRLVAQASYPVSDTEVMTVEALTDAQGAYRLEGLTPGDHRVFLHTPEGGQADPRFVEEVKAGQEVRLDIGLAGFAPLTVEVTRPKGEARDPEESITADAVELTLQADGTYQGTVEVTTRHVVGSDSLDRRASRDVKLAPGKPQRVKLPALARIKGMPFILPRGGKPTFFELAGHVLLADGTPVKGMRVSVQEPMDGPCGNVPRRFSHVRFEGSEFVVQPQSSSRKDTVYAWLEDGRAGSVEVSGTPGQRVVAIITLEETGAVTGRLPAEREEDERRSIVIDDLWFGAWHLTEPDGSFFVGGLAPGAHVLTVGEHKLPFTVRARERTDLGLVRLPATP